MANLQERLFQQRMKVIIQQSTDSPSNLPGPPTFRKALDNSGVGFSPMTGLALNLSDTSLGTPSPIQDSKRRLSMDDSSSSSSSPCSTISDKSSEKSGTPLTSISNRSTVKRSYGSSSQSRLTHLKNITNRDFSAENKENFPVFSPTKCRSPSKFYGSSPLKTKQGSIAGSPVRASQKVHINVLSPLKEVALLNKKTTALKRPIFNILDDEDSSSRDSGYNSQPLEGLAELDEDSNPSKKRSRTHLDEILENCSPGKEEEGIAPLVESPKEVNSPVKVESSRKFSDGFDIPSILEESSGSETDSPKISLNSLFTNKIILPKHLNSNPAFLSPEDSSPLTDKSLNSSSSFIQKKSLPYHLANSRPGIRRTLSMQENTSPESCLLSDSPLSRTSGPLGSLGLKPGFKRPFPPQCRQGLDTALGANKKRKFGMSAAQNQKLLTSENCGQAPKPVFVRSHSENELSIMRSCQLKEEVENILPDSSRLYALPNISACTKHPSLRSITCETLADVIGGKFNDALANFRIIDVRYKFEYEGGHIRGAENWQHGEDDKFLEEFMPAALAPLSTVPQHDVENETKRSILIFHCEFSSQRGPDFYMKLRERDRQLNKDVYPALYYPECYLLHLGYKEFFKNFPSLCTGSYTEMADPRHESELRKMRAKSKSWSGGTVARTSRMGRLHL